MKKTFISKETLSASNSMIMGHRPMNAELAGKFDLKKHLKENADQKIESFGLFDSSAPNFNTFYPGLTAEDLKPSEDDFVQPVFRALSEAIVRPHAPIDFGTTSALKDAMKLLNGQSVFANHEMITGDELGVVLATEWQEAKTVQLEDGSVLEVPAGINATLKLDGKSNPKIARGVMMNPPSIHSVSVTVEFEWAPSHPQMEQDEFFNKLGTFDANGELIKRNVVKVTRFHEISLVPHGADPFAQKIGEDGNISNPEYTAATYQFSETPSGKTVANAPVQGSHTSWKHLKADKEKLSYNGTTPTEQLTNNKENKNRELMLKFVKELLGSDAEGLSDEQLVEKLQSHIAGLTTLAESTTSLTEAKTALESEVTELKTTIAGLEPKATIADSALASVRNEAVRLCNLATDNKAEAGILSLIGESTYESALALKAQYQTLVDAKFGAQGSVELGDGDTHGNAGNDDESSKEPLSVEDAAAELMAEKHSVNTSGIHEEFKSK